MMATTDLVSHVQGVRRFSRFYTRQIGLLQEGLLGSPFSLTEARVIWELAHREAASASELAADLGLDAGYLSRMLRSFEAKGLIARQRSASDGRRSLISLTGEGRRAFARLDSSSSAQITSLLRRLAPSEQDLLVRAMGTIEGLLGPAAPSAGYVLRPPRPGDMGWVVHRHGALYAAEYGWDERFEALVAKIVADFVQHHDPGRERCWIAEQAGEPVGSVFLVRASDEVAKLRLLLVEPGARGCGLGTRLVNACVDFARAAGYRRITLWTNSVLLAARAIYQRTGFHLVAEEPHHSFGFDLIGETWELELQADQALPAAP
jgi:DNA-binding MarR family transcriptional regulator/GNAT superfamily N-acetyltransferase